MSARVDLCTGPCDGSVPALGLERMYGHVHGQVQRWHPRADLTLSFDAGAAETVAPSHVAASMGGFRQRCI